MHLLNALKYMFTILLKDQENDLKINASSLAQS